MNLDELLAYNPQKRAGNKRAREEDLQPSVKSRRQRLKEGAVGPSQRPAAAIPSPLQPTETSMPQAESASGLNGVSDEEKLRLLQEMGDEEDSDSKF